MIQTELILETNYSTLEISKGVERKREREQPT